jgi:hypothetical protein
VIEQNAHDSCFSSTNLIGEDSNNAFLKQNGGVKITGQMEFRLFFYYLLSMCPSEKFEFSVVISSSMIIGSDSFPIELQ